MKPLRATNFAIMLFLASLFHASAMTFIFTAPSTVRASGPIERGDAARFAGLPAFSVLELDSPGGLVGEALAIAADMDLRGNIRAVVPASASCASACAMAIFVSGQTRIVYEGGRLGIHSCANPDHSQALECNTQMAANSTAHGVPWGVIEGFGKYTKPLDMLWINAEDAECWGLIRWSSEDTSNDGLACYLHAKLSKAKQKPQEVDAQNANDILCRLNAGSSRIFIPSGLKEQGFSRAYQTACESVAADPSTPKYAAIDIILWLTLTDPTVRALKPGTLVSRIMDGEEGQANNCWKCLTILGISQASYGYLNDALAPLHEAENVVRRQTGSVPPWLTSRVDLIAAEAAASAH